MSWQSVWASGFRRACCFFPLAGEAGVHARGEGGEDKIENPLAFEQFQLLGVFWVGGMIGGCGGRPQRRFHSWLCSVVGLARTRRKEMLPDDKLQPLTRFPVSNANRDNGCAPLSLWADSGQRALLPLFRVPAVLCVNLHFAFVWFMHPVALPPTSHSHHPGLTTSHVITCNDKIYLHLRHSEKGLKACSLNFY